MITVSQTLETDTAPQLGSLELRQGKVLLLGDSPMYPNRLSIVLLLLGSLLCFGDEPLPSEYLEKVGGIPDFCQTDQRYGKFDGGGAMTCAPAAPSNSLVWLNQNGFPNILNKPNATKADQSDLIRRLSKPEFLDTTIQDGTSAKKLVLGIENFFKAAGYDCKVEQMHCRSSTRRIGTIPDETWMLKSCMGSSNLLINVGWCKTEKNHYQHFDGHWVTLVGFKEERGSRILLIHDPGHRGGNEKKSESCKLISLPAGHTFGKKGESIKTDGYFKLEGIRLKKGADLGIVEGAVAFTPAERQK